MKFLDYIKIAFKNLWRQKLRSFLTIVAVVIGAVSVVVMISLVLTARAVIVKQLESIGALTLVTITGDPDTIDTGDPFGGVGGGDNQGKKLDDTIIEKIKQVSHVTAVTPSVSVWAFQTARLKDGNGKKSQMQLLAYEPQPQFEKPLVVGRNLQHDDIAKIVLGGELARKFGYGDKPEDLVGKKVVLTTHEGYSGYGVDPQKPPQNADKDYWEKENKKIHEIEAEIIGVMAPSIGDNQSYTNLAWAREVMTSKRWEFDEEEQKRQEEQRRQEEEQKRQQGQRTFEQQDRNNDQPSSQPQKLVEDDEIEKRGYHFIQAKVDEIANVEDAASQIEKMDLGVATAKDFLDNITKLFTIVGAILGAIGAVSLTVAAIGIANTMVMAIFERTREIGIMRACGASRGTVRGLFTFEAALLGFWGGVIGIGISFALGVLGNYLGNRFASQQGILLQNIISFPWWLVFGVVGFTTVIGLIAGLYPAFRAARLDPVEALRYE